MAFGVNQERQLLQQGVNVINPLDKYTIDNLDDVAAGPKYFGYVGRGGTWVIQRQTITGDVSKFEYHTTTLAEQSVAAYLTAWTGRVGLTYKSGALTKFY